jgi:hypothetical protein
MRSMLRNSSVEVSSWISLDTFDRSRIRSAVWKMERVTSMKKVGRFAIYAGKS